VRESAEDFDRGGLARSVGAEEAEDFTDGYVEIDALDGLELAEGFGQSADGDGEGQRIGRFLSHGGDFGHRDFGTCVKIYCKPLKRKKT